MGINELVENFFDKNMALWEDTISTRNKYCLIDGINLWPTCVNECARAAKIVCKKQNLNPIVLFHKKEERIKYCKPLYRSFHIEEFIYLESIELKPIVLISTFIFLLIYLLIHFPFKMLNWKIGEIEIGKIIYDTCLIQKIKPKSLRATKIILATFLRYISYKWLLKKYDIDFAVLADKEYSIEGTLFQTLISFEKKVLVSGTTMAKMYDQNNFRESFMHPGISIEEIKQRNSVNIQILSECIENRMLGKISQHDVKNAYADKVLYSREQLKKELDITNSNPIAFVYPHVFSDAPHNASYLLFDDYREWFIGVLRVAKQNKQINFIVKPHPSAYMYGEQDSVMKEMAKNYSDNIYLCPKNFHNKSLINTCDLIITAQGTIALEMACYGVPSILAGAGYYNGYGFGMEFNSKEDYLNYIKNYNINKVFKLEEEIKVNALNVYYYIYKTKIIDNLYPSTIMHINDLKDADAYEHIFNGNLEVLINNLDNPKNKDFCNAIEKLIDNGY